MNPKDTVSKYQYAIKVTFSTFPLNNFNTSNPSRFDSSGYGTHNVHTKMHTRLLPLQCSLLQPQSHSWETFSRSQTDIYLKVNQENKRIHQDGKYTRFLLHGRKFPLLKWQLKLLRRSCPGNMTIQGKICSLWCHTETKLEKLLRRKCPHYLGNSIFSEYEYYNICFCFFFLIFESIHI